MNTKYDNVGGVRVLLLRKIQIFVRMKELEVPTVDELIVHQVLNQLPFSFDQLNAPATLRKINVV